MQSSHDRDHYITILKNNIIGNMQHNFNKYYDTHHYGQKYDYESLMHYPANAFSANGWPTILPNVSIQVFV